MSLSRELDPTAAAGRSEEEQRLAELAGDCVNPAEPTIPDANVATMAQMVESQGGVRTYMEESNEYLECLSEFVDDDDLEDDDHELLVSTYNSAVEDQEALAERFNTQRTLFLSLQ